MQNEFCVQHAVNACIENTLSPANEQLMSLLQQWSC